MTQKTEIPHRPSAIHRPGTPRTISFVGSNQAGGKQIAAAAHMREKKKKDRASSTKYHEDITHNKLPEPMLFAINPDNFVKVFDNDEGVSHAVANAVDHAVDHASETNARMFYTCVALPEVCFDTCEDVTFFCSTFLSPTRKWGKEYISDTFVCCKVTKKMASLARCGSLSLSAKIAPHDLKRR